VFFLAKKTPGGAGIHTGHTRTVRVTALNSQHSRYLLPDRHVRGTRTPVLFRTAIMHASIDGRLTTRLYSHCRYCVRVVSADNTERATRGSNPREGLTSQQPLPALCRNAADSAGMPPTEQAAKPGLRRGAVQQPTLNNQA
jgi:hypothetical protein